MNITLTEDQARILRAENALQDAARAYELDDTSPAAEAAFAAAADGTPGMSVILRLQNSLPAGSCLLWPDGTVARFASVDLSPESASNLTTEFMRAQPRATRPDNPQKPLAVGRRLE